MEEKINPKKLPTMDWDWLEEKGLWDRTEAAKWIVPINPNALAYIEKLKFLPLVPSAQLGRTAEMLTPQSLKHLRGFGKLRKLSFPNLLTDEGMKYIGQLGMLHTLYISQNKLTNDGVKHLANLTNLKDFEANNLPPGGESIRILASLPKLTSLSLPNNADVTDEDLTALKNTKLKVLCITGENITGECLKHIGQIKTLKELMLGGSTFIQNINDDHLKYISGLINLRRITLKGTLVTVNGLKHLEPLKSLKKLMLPTSMPSTPEAKALKKAIPGLSIKDGL